MLPIGMYHVSETPEFNIKWTIKQNINNPY